MAITTAEEATALSNEVQGREGSRGLFVVPQEEIVEKVLAHIESHKDVRKGEWSNKEVSEYNTMMTLLQCSLIPAL